MKKAISLSVFLFITSLLLEAQIHGDYIVTLKEDTIYGEIKYKPFSKQMVFHYNKRKFVFNPGSLKFFGTYRNGQYQHYKTLRPTGWELIFVQVLTEGKLNLYHYHHLDERYPPPHVRRLYFLGPTDKKLATISTRSYGPVIKFMFKDYPSISGKASRSTFDEVPGIVAAYNQL